MVAHLVGSLLPIDPHSFPWGVACVWQDTERPDILGLFGFFGCLLAVTLGLNSSWEGKGPKGGAVFHMDRAVTSQLKESMSCPARMGKLPLKWSPGLPSTDLPPASLPVQISTQRNRDTMTKEFIHWLFNACHTWGIRTGIRSRDRKEYSRGILTWTDSFGAKCSLSCD